MALFNGRSLLLDCPVLRVSYLERPRGLARACAAGCSAFVLAGCLIDAPPEFDSPPRKAPVIYEAWVDPPLFLPLVVDTTDPNVRSIPFNIPFQLEDSTHRMLVSGWLNYGFERPISQRIDAWEEQPDAAAVLPDGPAAARLFSFSVPATDLVTRGPCARLTMFLHYYDDFDVPSFRPVDEAFEQGRVDQVHWWVVANAAPADVSFADCPTPSVDSNDGDL